METRKKEVGFCSRIMTVRTGCILIFACMFMQLHAQTIWQERKGTMSFQGDLAPGYLFSEKTLTAYADGDVELFLDDRVGFTGALWASFPTTRKDQPGIKANHALFWGANYHFLKPSRWDPYIGFTPGFGLVREAFTQNDQLTRTPFSIAPLVSASVGCNYYVGSIFHFFVQIQAVEGQILSTLPSARRLDELKFMAGLGWNFRLWKPKHHDVWKGKTNAG